MAPPEKPLPSDYCGAGCVPCVYDSYVEQLKAYQAWLKKQAKEKTNTQPHDA